MEGDRNPDPIKVVLGALARVPRRDRARVEAGARAMLGMNVEGVVRHMRAAQKHVSNKYLWIFAGVVLLFIVGMVVRAVYDKSEAARNISWEIARAKTLLMDIYVAPMGMDAIMSTLNTRIDRKIYDALILALRHVEKMIHEMEDNWQCAKMAVAWVAILDVIQETIVKKKVTIFRDDDRFIVAAKKFQEKVNAELYIKYLTAARTYITQEVANSWMMLDADIISEAIIRTFGLVTRKVIS